jgi:CheY-like chemotaxis protein
MKSEPALAKTAVIFVSSVGARPEFASRLAGLDIAGWLMKPVPESSLYNELLRVLTAEQRAAARQGMNYQEAPPMNRFTLPPGVDRHVLLAEDNPINQKMAKLQLAKLGLEVDAVDNGRQAVETALRHHYDVIFMDCQMSELDGYAATRQLRQREPAGSHSKIIAMTAHALPGDREKCMAAGMDAYISKPVTQEALEAMLKELFPAASSHSAAQQVVLTPPDSPATKTEAPAELEPLTAAQVATDAPAKAQSPQPRLSADQPLPTIAATPKPVASVSETSPAAASTNNGASPTAETAPGPPVKSPDEVCDRATLDGLWAEGDCLLPELVGMFQSELTKELDELDRALIARDWAAAARIAHTLMNFDDQNR